MPRSPDIDIRLALPGDASLVAGMVMALTQEIVQQLPPAPQGSHFDIDLLATAALCRDLLERGHYRALLAYAHGQPVAVATLAMSHALYAGGVIGILQELYVEPAWRTSGVGAALLGRLLDLARETGCACIELCTPPLPQFERTLQFYQAHGFNAVGGRKMRRAC